MPNDHARIAQPKSVTEHGRRPRADKASDPAKLAGTARQPRWQAAPESEHAAEVRLQAAIRRGSRASG